MYELPEETINKILAYLGKQPYEQVWTLVQEVQQNAKKADNIKVAPNKAKKEKK
jgi:hypothetical protein